MIFLTIVVAEDLINLFVALRTGQFTDRTPEDIRFYSAFIPTFLIVLAVKLGMRWGKRSNRGARGYKTATLADKH